MIAQVSQESVRAAKSHLDGSGSRGGGGSGSGSGGSGSGGSRTTSGTLSEDVGGRAGCCLRSGLSITGRVLVAENHARNIGKPRNIGTK